MKITNLILALASVVLISCTQGDPNKQVDEGSVKAQIYQSKEIGWSIEIPGGWNVVSKDSVEANEQKGRDAIEQSSGLEVDTKALKHLISFQKDQFNFFASTSEPFQEESEGEYYRSNKTVYEVIYKAIADQGIKADTSSGREMIQGLEFLTFNTTIYGPDGKVILRQVLYSRLINGYDFGVNINYNNEQDKQAMIGAWKNSKFTGHETSARQ